MVEQRSQETCNHSSAEVIAWAKVRWATGNCPMHHAGAQERQELEIEAMLRERGHALSSEDIEHVSAVIRGLYLHSAYLELCIERGELPTEANLATYMQGYQAAERGLKA